MTPTLDLGDLPPAAPEDVELGAAATGASGGASSSNAPPPPSPEETKRLEAHGVAVLLVTVGTELAARRWPRLTFTEEEKRGTAELAGPVLAKYDVRSAFLADYKEELALGLFLLGLIRRKVDELGPTEREVKGERVEDQPLPESMSPFEAVERGLYK